MATVRRRIYRRSLYSHGNYRTARSLALRHVTVAKTQHQVTIQGATTVAEISKSWSGLSPVFQGCNIFGIRFLDPSAPARLKLLFLTTAMCVNSVLFKVDAYEERNAILVGEEGAII